MARRVGAVAGVAAAAVGWLLGRRYRRVEVAEESMAPALLPGDHLMVRARWAPLRRGDVVVFEHPDKAGFHLIKRVVGLPTETIAIRDGAVVLEGSPLPEPWADGPTRGNGSWTLGEAEVFVLGDSRALSIADSRELGPLPVDAIALVAVWRYWPPSRIGRPAESA